MVDAFQATSLSARFLIMKGFQSLFSWIILGDCRQSTPVPRTIWLKEGPMFQSLVLMDHPLGDIACRRWCENNVTAIPSFNPLFSWITPFGLD